MNYKVGKMLTWNATTAKVIILRYIIDNAFFRRNRPE